MSDTKSNYSDYVRFILKAELANSLILDSEPEGWEDDDLEITRHKEYHGIFTSFSSKLKFNNDAKDYIKNAYSTGGINTDLRLIKQVLRDTKNIDGTKDVRWTDRYSAIADYSTMEEKDNRLEIKFNSNDLAELIKSHEGDDFEIQRLDSIDGVLLEPLNTSTLDLEGRSIGGVAESVNNLLDSHFDENGVEHQRLRIPSHHWIGPATTVLTQGPSQRHSQMTPVMFDKKNPADLDALNAMFFSDDILQGTSVNISFSIKIKCNLKRVPAPPFVYNTSCRVVRYKRQPGSYIEVERLGDVFSLETNTFTWLPVDVTKNFNVTNLEYNEGLALIFDNDGGHTIARIYDLDIVINSVEQYESTPDVKFVFVHDVFDRIIRILTGEKNRFYSKFYGRTELTDDNGNQIYTQDGISEDGSVGGGLIGFTSGYWIRKFDELSEKYKSPVINLKELVEASKVVFNTGLGIEIKGFKEILRIEELKYFYRNEVAVKLPFQVTKVKRKVDDKFFNSGITLGYTKGGDYENEIGLDEPNTQTSWVTPIRKTKNKYSMLSKVRADEYGMEITRRKPQSLFPSEDTGGDEDNWFMDIKRDIVQNNKFFLARWQDRLSQMPTGIYNPDSFRSMIFTPLRLLFRHGWVVRAGMELYLSKMIKYTSSIANSTLKMKFDGESEYAENEDILTSDLNRSRLLPEEVSFEHPVDDELIDLIYGTTRVLVNGSYEDVPNFYFKFEYINEDGEIERGYLSNLKPGANGKFKMIKANENILNQ